MKQSSQEAHMGPQGVTRLAEQISHRLAFHAYNSPVAPRSEFVAARSLVPAWLPGERRAMSRRVIFRLILFFMAGAVLYIIAGLGTDDLVLSHKCGSEFNYYGVSRPPKRPGRLGTPPTRAC